MKHGRSFSDALAAGWQQRRFVSVGLDGDTTRLPSDLRDRPTVDALVEFHRRLVVATSDRALAYKPQSAGYEALGAEGWAALVATVEMVRDVAPGTPVILDAKRADIGSTNEQYARAAFDVVGADALTVHPYLGPEAMAPFLERADRGIIVLCRTSNPGAGRYQDLIVDGLPLYQRIAVDVAETWNENGNCGLVVGATYPEELAAVRQLVANLPILVPGVGAQGGDVSAAMKAGLTSSGGGVIVHASRSLMYAYQQAERGTSVEDATRNAMAELHESILDAIAP